MSVIVPTITTDSPEVYKDQMGKIRQFSLRVHIDVSDGVFAPTKLTPPEKIWWPEGMEVDIHMMVVKPSDYMDTLLKLKPSMVIFHFEVEEDLPSLMGILKQSGIKAGLAVMRSTFPGHKPDTVHQADHIMLFSGELGKQGGKASLMQLEKVRMLTTLNGDADIGWDGGINMENAFTISKGGVEVLNVGHAIMGTQSPDVAYRSLTEEINKSGIF